MRIVCISSSNIRHVGSNSTSLKVCLLIQRIISELTSETIDVDIIKLVDHDFQSCDGCGRCRQIGSCFHDTQFNNVYGRMVSADAAFIVAAHYAPIPSKLCILSEKIEQIAFLPRFTQKDARSPLHGKPVGIIAHGGGTEEMMFHYEALVLNTIANALSWPVEMNIIKDPMSSANGVVFPVAKVDRSSESDFPIHTYNWELIRRRAEPMIKAVLDASRWT